VPVPSSAVAKTRTYFTSRGLKFDSTTADTPLLATLAGAPLSYGALYETFTRFVRRAIAASKLNGFRCSKPRRLRSAMTEAPKKMMIE